MERMKLTEKEKEQILKNGAEAMSKIIERMSIEMGELEEENKKLKSDLAFERTMLDNVRAEYKSLQDIIKNLNIKVASLEGEIKGLNSVIDKLKEENQTLELWLDNKEKVNKSLREELSAYDREYFDEDKKAKNIFMEEDTLQELRDIGKL